MFAIVHAQFADDAAGRMLHLLNVLIDDDRALRDQRAGNLDCRRPAADAATEQQQDGDTGKKMAADRRARSGRPRGKLTFGGLPAVGGKFLRARDHTPALPLSGTIFSGCGTAGRCRTLLRTSSFGPKACVRPSFITSI